MLCEATTNYKEILTFFDLWDAFCFNQNTVVIAFNFFEKSYIFCLRPLGVKLTLISTFLSLLLVEAALLLIKERLKSI